jgi:phosphoribosylanthranilate isomerase
MTKVKICGLCTTDDVAGAVKAGADMVGMVLSAGFRRSVPMEEAREMARLVPDGVVKVGVFVNEDPESVSYAVKTLGLGAVQLHGSEDDEYVSRIKGAVGVPVTKSFVVRDMGDIEAARRSPADLVLLDGGAGSGTGFDRSLASGLGRDFILAGGLDPGNVAQAVAETRPFAVDVSSGVETGGAKDPAKMTAFVRNAKEAAEACR